jgi:hypothetical protein
MAHAPYPHCAIWNLVLQGLDMGWIKVGMSRVSMIHIFFFCLLEDCFRFCLFGEWDGIMED